MSARLTDRELDNVLDAWFDEGPATVSNAALAEALARIPTTPRRRMAGRWLGPLAELPQAEFWRPAMRVAGILVVLAAMVGVVALAALIGAPPGPGPSPAPATATPDTNQAPSAATGQARAVVSGAAELEITYSFCSDPEIPPSVEQFSYPGLQEYQFHEVGFGTCPEASGYGFRLYVGPDDSVRPGEEVPTGDRVVLRFTFPRHFAVSRPYTNSHLSDGGECGVTFARFTETVIEGSFDCSSVPSLVDAELIDVTGEFSFDPGADRPVQTPPPTSVELQLEGSPLPADQWEFKGCPPVTITEPDGARVCRFTDGWHRLEIYGLSQPGLQPGVLTTSAQSVRVLIWWYRGEIGDTLHTGDFESVAGECQLNLAALTDTHADVTIDCLAVPGRYATAVGGPEQEATVNLHGSFSINPSVGAIEGF